MQRPVRPALRIVRSSESRQLLAMVEAEVGSLLELLPVPVLVTREAGIVLRANPAAGVALAIAEHAVVGRCIEDVLRHSGQLRPKTGIVRSNACGYDPNKSCKERDNFGVRESVHVA